MRFTYLSIFPENNVTYLPKIENEGCFTHIFLRNFTEWVIFSVILENFIWRQKYFSQMSFVTNSISGPQLSKWILCLERESCVGVRHHSPQSGLWASTIPVRSKVKISRKTCPMLRRKDSIHYGINGSLSIKVQEQGAMHHRPVQQLQSGQSFSQRSKHAGHSLFLYLLSIWSFPK